MRRIFRVLSLVICLVLGATVVSAETTTRRQLGESNAPESQADAIAAAEREYTQALDEYVNTVAGYSLQYPAAFASENFLSEDENGFTAKLRDGTAEIMTERIANTNSLSLKSYVKILAARTPSMTTEYSRFEDKVRTMSKRKDGFTQADIYIVTEQWIYHVMMAWAPSRDREYQVNCGYVMNSFVCDEISEG